MTTPPPSLEKRVSIACLLHSNPCIRSSSFLTQFMRATPSILLKQFIYSTFSPLPSTNLIPHVSALYNSVGSLILSYIRTSTCTQVQFSIKYSTHSLKPPNPLPLDCSLRHIPFNFSNRVHMGPQVFKSELPEVVSTHSHTFIRPPLLSLEHSITTSTHFHSQCIYFPCPYDSLTPNFICQRISITFKHS